MSRVISRYLAPVYLLLCLLLGGASAAGYLANGVLQIVGIVFILAVLLSGALPDLPRPCRILLGLFAAAAALLLLEILPLPPALWSLLPGRDVVAEGYSLLGLSAPWLPISLSPDSTVAILPALIPPLTMTLLIFASTGYGRLYAIYILVATAAASIFLGVFQRMQGPDSPYYIYEITNRGGVVGLFANRNHLATLLLSALPFIGALAVSPKRKAQMDSKVGRLMITGCLALLIAIGIVVVKSAAGWMLLVPALFAALAVYVRGEKGEVPRALWQIGAVIGAVCLIAAVVAPIKVNDLGDRLSGIDPHMRNQTIRTTAAAAVDHLPFGSGGGTFQRVYPAYEDVEAASLEYVNHAHNDYVEVALEHGLPGLALILFAVYFWFVRGARLWRKDRGDVLSRAGFVTLGVLIAHSLVDYPLRTAAIAAVGALAAALMVAPVSVEMPTWQSSSRRPKRSGSGARTIEIALAD